KLLAGDGTLDSISNKEKKGKTYNILDGDPDVENCNGWSRTVTRKDFHQLKGSHIGFFMVNLTKVSI
ncbi:cupin domain-containing protein, partial [Klebsiella pneumoniae]